MTKADINKLLKPQWQCFPYYISDYVLSFIDLNILWLHMHAVSAQKWICRIAVESTIEQTDKAFVIYRTWEYPRAQMLNNFPFKSP